jgi:acetyl-CoA acetyltransferase
MTEVYVVGSFSTQFKKWPDKSWKDLTRQACAGVLQDAGIEAKDIQSAWFSNTGWGNSLPPRGDDPGMAGQMNVRGQVALAPLVNEGLFPAFIPVTNVEGACASGSIAFNGAWKDIQAGQSDVAIAIGVEKTFFPNHLELVIGMFAGGTDITELPKLSNQYKEVCDMVGKEWNHNGGHTIFMDVYAVLGAWHMWKWGTTQKQIAMIASKNHYHGSLNPLAQYQFEVPVEKVLSDYPVSWPLTRSMCAPLGDGSAAAVLCSGAYLSKLPSGIRRRAVQVMASVYTNGRERKIEEPSVSYYACERAYKTAGISPADVSLAEVHDATAVAELYQTEMLGFCPVGQGGKFAESGATRFDGSKPINTSGGLECKGHPIGATGLSQVNEIVMQLRGEAGRRQVKDPQIGLVENGGGVISFDEFCCAITILKRIQGGK